MSAEKEEAAAGNATAATRGNTDLAKDTKTPKARPVSSEDLLQLRRENTFLRLSRAKWGDDTTSFSISVWTWAKSGRPVFLKSVRLNADELVPLAEAMLAAAEASS